MTTALLAHCQTAISSFKPSLTTVDAHVEDYLTVHKVRAATRVALSLDGNDSAYWRTDAGATKLHLVGYRNERAAIYPANHVRMRALQEALQGNMLQTAQLCRLCLDVMGTRHRWSCPAYTSSTLVKSYERTTSCTSCTRISCSFGFATSHGRGLNSSSSCKKKTECFIMPLEQPFRCTS